MTELSPTTHLPVLPLRDIVVFPHMIVPLFVGRDKSVRVLEAVMSENKQILLLTQTDAAIEDPGAEEMFTMGTIGNILQLLKLPDGTVKVLVEGVARANVSSLDESGAYMTGEAVELEDEQSGEAELVGVERRRLPAGAGGEDLGDRDLEGRGLRRRRSRHVRFSPRRRTRCVGE